MSKRRQQKRLKGRHIESNLESDPTVLLLLYRFSTFLILTLFPWRDIEIAVDGIKCLKFATISDRRDTNKGASPQRNHVFSINNSPSVVTECGTDHTLSHSDLDVI